MQKKPPCPSLAVVKRMTRRLGIIGAGGHGKVAADVAQRCGWDEVVFFDDRAESGPFEHAHWQVVDHPGEIESYRCNAIFVAIGNAMARQQWCERVVELALPLASLVDPGAIVSEYAQIEPGVLIVAGAVINVDSQVRRGAIVNTRASVDHDCIVGAYSHICPATALAGGVIVGERSWIGIGSQVKQSVTIGSDVMVGAGSTVLSDIPDSVTVVGTPARQI